MQDILYLSVISVISDCLKVGVSWSFHHPTWDSALKNQLRIFSFHLGQTKPSILQDGSPIICGILKLGNKAEALSKTNQPSLKQLHFLSNAIKRMNHSRA